MIPVRAGSARARDLRRFELVRDEVTGVGVVGLGVTFPDGSVALHWNTDVPSMAFYSDIADVEAIHGRGSTRVVFEERSNAW